MDQNVIQSPYTTPVEVNLITLIVNQIAEWKATLRSLQDYFAEVSLIESQSLNAHSKLAAALVEAVPLGLDSVLGSPKVMQETRNNAWLAPLQSVALRAASASEAYVAYLKEQTIGQFISLRAEYKKSSRALLEKLSISQRDLNRFQAALTKALSEHGAGQEDRWLTEQRLKQAASSFLAEKERFLVSLHSLYGECKLLISSIGSQAANLASEALLVRAKQTTLLAEQLGDSSVRMSSIDLEVEWEHALVKHRLDFEWSLSAPPLDAFLQHLLPDTVESRVYKQGSLQCKMGAFRQWTTLQASLTTTGYLHLFMDNEAVLSIPLAEDGTTIVGANDRDLTITLASQPGLFGRGERKHTLRFPVDTEMVEWLLAIRTIRDEVLARVTQNSEEVAEKALEEASVQDSSPELHNVKSPNVTTPMVVMEEDNPWA